MSGGMPLHGSSHTPVVNVSHVEERELCEPSTPC